MRRLGRTGTGMSIAPFGERGRAEVVGGFGRFSRVALTVGRGALQERSMTPGF